MKNKLNIFFILILVNFFYFYGISAEELKINAESININKNTKTVFLKNQVSIIDEKKNHLEAIEADYLKEKDLVRTYGPTKVKTSESFYITGSTFTFDNFNGFISSDQPAIILDREKNEISVQNFYYDRNKNLYSSKGKIKVLDKNGNTFFFTEIYIDEKKEKIVGSDVKAFLDSGSLSVETENNTRIFANSISISEGKSELGKSILTYCKFRENDKCPPWSIQANKIKHDTATKTVYYENAVLKIYDFPVLYMPKFFHPDPSVERRSGFLVPSFSKTSNVGSAILTPYFVNFSNEKDLTITPHMYVNNNPLLQAEFRQAFKNASLIVDAGYTQGYKKKTPSKTGGSRNHFFSSLSVDLSDNEEIYENLEMSLNYINNDTYLDVYDLKTFMDNEDNIIDNNLDYTFDNNNYLLNFNPHVYKDLGKSGNKRYEYILPITYQKNLITKENLGLLSFDSNLEIKNFDVDQESSFLVNNLNWKSNSWIDKLGSEGQFLTSTKLVNYTSDEVEGLKNGQDNTELYGSIGYLSKLPFFKNHKSENKKSSFTPKMLLRFAPGHTRKLDKHLDLDYSSLFDLNRLNTNEVMETGLSTTLGFDYKYNEQQTKNETKNKREIFSLSAGQIIQDENNNNLPSSINSKLSDLVGSAKWSPNENFSVTNNYTIDQNYKEFNSNEIGTEININKIKFNLNYLEEKNHFTEQEYVQSKINLNTGDNTSLSFGGKRNLLRDSSEYYNLAYEYFNDCLKAGLAYRREFYTDRDIEPKNTLMFTITVKPFGDFDSIEFEDK
jgi:LPS-assembly protein